MRRERRGKTGTKEGSARRREPFIYSQRGGGQEADQPRPARVKAASESRPSSLQPASEPLISEPPTAPTSHFHPPTHHPLISSTRSPVHPPTCFLLSDSVPAHHRPPPTTKQRKDSKGHGAPTPPSQPLVPRPSPKSVTSHRWADVRTRARSPGGPGPSPLPPLGVHPRHPGPWEKTQKAESLFTTRHAQTGGNTRAHFSRHHWAGAGCVDRADESEEAGRSCGPGCGNLHTDGSAREPGRPCRKGDGGG